MMASPRVHWCRISAGATPKETKSESESSTAPKPLVTRSRRAARPSRASKIAEKRIGKRYDLTKPQGVRGRNSDNTRLREVVKWEPSVSLEDGLAVTYHWIAGQLEKQTSHPQSAQMLTSV